MKSSSLQRITRRLTKLAIPVAVLLAASSVSQAQGSYQITDGSGNILPAAAGLYTLHWNCYNAGSPPGMATICSWYVRRLYGNQSPVVVVNDYPHATPPGCQYGVTALLDPGYSRSGCAIFATAAVYGIN